MRQATLWQQSQKLPRYLKIRLDSQKCWLLCAWGTHYIIPDTSNHWLNLQELESNLAQWSLLLRNGEKNCPDLLFHFSPNLDFFFCESSSSSWDVPFAGLGVTGLPGVSGLGLLSKSDPTGMIFLRPPDGVSWGRWNFKLIKRPRLVPSLQTHFMQKNNRKS